ncbi:MAG: Flp pilus assembly complex ATPase component TadA [Candidatus Aureabacteria bacterium]|nr:Flp pilus assembly complex ATPase component TadA [Candidatus Auribacterota bacterium]
MARKQDTVKLLLKKGLITEEEIKTANDDMKKTGWSLEKTLEKLGYITEEEIASASAETLEIPYIDLEDYTIDPEVIKLVPEDLAKKHKTIPLFKVGDTVTLGMLNPQNIAAIDDIRMKTKIGSIDTVLVTEKGLQKAVDSYYGMVGSVDEIIKDIDKARIEITAESGSKEITKIVEEPPVIKMVNLIVAKAVKDKASDIHVEPDEKILRIRNRIDGILYESSLIPKDLQAAVISRIKILSNMDIAERRMPQDGRFKMKVENRDIDIRVSCIPTMYGENVVMRLLDMNTALISLRQLGLSPENLKNYEMLIKKPYGIILVTGPTGCGKTTTLYSSLSTINDTEKNIITIEDPVEYRLNFVRQIQVNQKVDLTFSNGLRSILRQDPDVIMVGEIRDLETADIAIHAALTGHIVFSTLHTNDAPGALTRLVDMGLEPFLVSSAIIAVAAQRLVRKICPECKESYKPNEKVLEELGLDPKEKGINLYRGNGCDKCMNTGYKGRAAIFELMIPNEEIRELTIAKTSTDEIKKAAAKAGMKNMRQDGLEKARKGITTVEEVLRLTQEERK